MGGNMTFLEVRAFQDRVADLMLVNGEIMKVSILRVDSQYEDILVDIIDTNQPERYLHSKATYAIRISDLISIEESATQS